jgi:hypothetical protein
LSKLLVQVRGIDLRKQLPSLDMSPDMPRAKAAPPAGRTMRRRQMTRALERSRHLFPETAKKVATAMVPLSQKTKPSV